MLALLPTPLATKGQLPVKCWKMIIPNLCNCSHCHHNNLFNIPQLFTLDLLLSILCCYLSECVRVYVQGWPWESVQTGADTDKPSNDGWHMHSYWPYIHWSTPKFVMLLRVDQSIMGSTGACKTLQVTYDFNSAVGSSNLWSMSKHLGGGTCGVWGWNPFNREM